jgi:hypothetical protein
MMMFAIINFLVCFAAVSAFAPTSSCTQPRAAPKLSRKDDSDTNSNAVGFNPMNAFSDILSTMDDMIDDFFYKRMGNGEIFYGKRKVRPSGRVEGEYNGFGLTDKQRIEDSRLIKLARLEQKRLREQDKTK